MWELFKMTLKDILCQPKTLNVRSYVNLLMWDQILVLCVWVGSFD